MEQLVTSAAPAAVGPYAQGVRAGDTVYVSGQLGLDPETGTLAPTDTQELMQALKNAEAVLQAAGLVRTDIVKVTLYVTDMGRFAALNEVYAEFFADHRPARSAVEAATLPKGAAVEVDVIAAGRSR